MSLPVTIGVFGASGRMGRALQDICHQCTQPVIVSSKNWKTDFQKSDVVVDFSVASAIIEHGTWAVQHKKPYMICVTGLEPEILDSFPRWACSIPVLHAPNTSLMITWLTHMLKNWKHVLNADHDVDIYETHHCAKKDAPSGTAKVFQDILNSPVHASRLGHSPGEHSLKWVGRYDQMTITHQAWDRKLFAQGARKGAQWLSTQPKGLYTMENVYGFSPLSS